MSAIKESLAELRKDPIFQEWKNKSKDSYLCHCLRMVGEEDAWYFGFYNKDDTITTFAVSTLAVSKEEKEEVFKKPESEVKPIIESDIKITSLEALDNASELVGKEYSGEVLSKNIVLLQNLDLGQVYNITFITLSMSTINIKIDSLTGEVKEHKRTSLMDFKVQ